MSKSDYEVTPSAGKKILPNMEHAEARQMGIDQERRAYIETLTGDCKHKMEVVEEANSILREAQVPFSLMAYPQTIIDDTIRPWHHHALSYKDPFANKDDYNECMKLAWVNLTDIIGFSLKVLPLTIAIYNHEKQLVKVFEYEPAK